MPHRGQRHTVASRARRLQGLFLVPPDAAIDDREEAKNFLKDALQPPLDAVKALNDMRARAPATVIVATRGRDPQHATIWDPSRTYSRPTEWLGFRQFSQCRWRRRTLYTQSHRTTSPTTAFLTKRVSYTPRFTSH